MSDLGYLIANIDRRCLERGSRLYFYNDFDKMRYMRIAEQLVKEMSNADGILTGGFGSPKGFIQICLKSTV